MDFIFKLPRTKYGKIPCIRNSLDLHYTGKCLQFYRAKTEKKLFLIFMICWSTNVCLVSIMVKAVRCISLEIVGVHVCIQLINYKKKKKKTGGHGL